MEQQLRYNPRPEDLVQDTGAKYEPVSYSEPIPSETKRKGTHFQKWNITLSIIVVVACIAATILVVLISNNRPVRDWKVRPSVILAILSSIVAVLLGYLFSAGVSIRWWDSIQRGTTIEHLHQITNRAILLQPQNWKWKLFEDSSFTKIFVGACAIGLSAFASQPFIQQATKTKLASIETDGVQMQIDILPEIPDGLSGTITTQSTYNTSGSFDLTAAAVQWYQNDTIRTKNTAGYTCDGTCSGTIRAPGISVECEAFQEDYNLKEATTTDKDLFSLSFNLAEDANSIPYIDFTAVYTESVDASCKAFITTENCKVYYATTQYPIEVYGDSVFLIPRTYWDLNSTERIATPGDSLSAADGSRAGPLHGLMYLGNGYLNSYTRIRRSEVNGLQLLPTSGLPTEIFYIYTNRSSTNEIPKGCDLTWRRPTDYVLNAMSETLFRLAMNGNRIANSKATGNVTPLAQSFTVRLLRTEFVFKSSYEWLAGAVVVELLATILALTLVWGWWSLEREVTLSPIETLQSMSALALGKDMSADEIVEKFGWLQVHYIPKGGQVGQG